MGMVLCTFDRGFQTLAQRIHAASRTDRTCGTRLSASIACRDADTTYINLDAIDAISSICIASFTTKARPTAPGSDCRSTARALQNCLFLKPSPPREVYSRYVYLLARSR